MPKVVIKGLPTNLIDCLPAELESLGFAGTTATQVKLSKPVQCPPVIIQLPTGTDMAKFKQIKYLANCVVVIERYKTSSKNCTQCYRCQGFGHASRNCNRPARCVKCSLAHPTSQCPKKGFIETARCCNCGQDHAANYSLCKERVKYLERIKTKRESFRNAIVKSTHVATKQSVPSQMFPVKAAGAPKCHNSQTLPSRVPPRTAPPSEDRTNMPQDTMTSEMLEILSTIKTLKKDYIKCDTFMDKVILILSHLGHYV